MKFLKKYKLNESPDEIKSQGLSHHDADTYTFGYVDGEMKVIYNGVHYDIFDKSLEKNFINEYSEDLSYMLNDEDFINDNSNEDGILSENLQEVINRSNNNELLVDDIENYYGHYFDDYLDELKSSGEYDEEFMEWRNDNNIGRLWESSKIISFWDYPKNNNELHSIILDIEKESTINIWDDREWKIEIYEIKDNSIKRDDLYNLNIDEYNIKDGIIYTTDNNDLDVTSKLIPLREFTSSIALPEKLVKLHLMSPIEKEKYYKAHPDKRPKLTKTKNETDFAWRQAINRSESIMKNVNSFKLFEAELQPQQEIQAQQPQQEKIIPLSKYKDIIDFTYLKSGATKQNITDLIDLAIENNFYSVCVPIEFVDHAKFSLEDSEIKLVSVLDFPEGKSNITENLNDAIKLISNGVDEIDMVMDYESFKKAYKSTDEDSKVSTYNNIEKEIKVIADECHKNGTILKVIIESGLLTIEEITKVCEIISNSGADFIQTSTGTKGIGTELTKVKEIRRVINDYIKIKVAGGIRTIQDCEKFYPYVDRIGTSVIPK